MMSTQSSLISIIMTMIFLQILSIHSTPIHIESNHHDQLMEENANDNHHHSHQQFLSFIKSIIDESNPHEQLELLNQLREYLNEICVLGYLGATHTNACQHVINVIDQNYFNNHSNEQISETSNETHGIQKRFFCNGFIGCKSSSG